MRMSVRRIDPANGEACYRAADGTEEGSSQCPRSRDSGGAGKTTTARYACYRAFFQRVCGWIGRVAPTCYQAAIVIAQHGGILSRTG